MSVPFFPKVTSPYPNGSTWTLSSAKMVNATRDTMLLGGAVTHDGVYAEIHARDFPRGSV
jgi:hypothetical protein